MVVLTLTNDTTSASDVLIKRDVRCPANYPTAYCSGAGFEVRTETKIESANTTGAGTAVEAGARAGALLARSASMSASVSVWHLCDVPANATTADTSAGGTAVQLRVTCPTVTDPSAIVGVRYGYIDWPLLTVYNRAGLPMPPFSHAQPSERPH